MQGPLADAEMEHKGPSRPQEDGRDQSTQAQPRAQTVQNEKPHGSDGLELRKYCAPSFPLLHPNQISLIMGFRPLSPPSISKPLSRLGLRKLPPALRWSRNQLPISRQRHEMPERGS